MYYSDEVALRINECLKKNGLSQKDMLEKCNLSKNTISSMLSRGSMPRADNLAKIADYLNCSIDYLIGRDPFFLQKQTETYDSDLDFLNKLHSLPEDSQDEITHMLNYKYEQLQKKRKESLSLSGSETMETSHDMLA